MGADTNKPSSESRRPQQQQKSDPTQSTPMQQNRQGAGSGQGGRIDTDGDGRSRDPRDNRPTDQGGRGRKM